MHIPILVEPIEGGRFRACAGEPFAVSVEAASKPEAIRQLQSDLAARLQGGTELLTIIVGANLTAAPNPTKRPQDDPLWEEWKMAMAEYRRQIDEGPDLL